MGRDLLYELSSKELKDAIDEIVANDSRILPARGKVLAALVQLQGNTGKPEVVNHEKLSELKKAGGLEMDGLLIPPHSLASE
ncbi:hypothetical protein [Roseimicrobium gellanilyticum]|uniref:hypothetical protein n=1 Tax=Roseimicrobium gellanilyticum TaxID=748857 RepID=UPI001474764A|nr:hypothetical protein [Roseimicrobium gellanilyticum]